MHSQKIIIMKDIAYGNNMMRKITLLCCFYFALFSSFCNITWSESEEDQNLEHFNVGYKVLDFQYLKDKNASVITVAVWSPTKANPERFHYAGSTYGNVTINAEPFAGGRPYPLLVFSHGYGGSGLSATFFTEALAAHGWIV